ncbi:hypothetical protein SPRA44_90011 [Serratia proteamaculans]|nr:hypothetical protein SPRA44_90011 [Serratia proteamaculans]
MSVIHIIATYVLLRLLIKALKKAIYQQANNSTSLGATMLNRTQNLGFCDLTWHFCKCFSQNC